MLNIIYMGTPDFAVEPLQVLIDSPHHIQAVFTQPDKARGRSGTLQPTPVKETALAAGLTVYTPVKIREEEYVQLIRELAPDVIVVAAFGQIIPKSILEIPKFGCINIHASLLPKYRGAAPIQWAVIDGEAVSGVTIMQMGEGLDTGDMLLQRSVPLAPDETGGSLFDKLMHLGAQMLPEVLLGLEKGTLTPVPQPEESPTAYAGMLTKTDGLIDWKKDAAAIGRLIRALDPWPGTYTYLNGKQLKICKAEPVGDCAEADEAVSAAADPAAEKPAAEPGKTGPAQAAPGTVTEVLKDSFTVQTGSGSLRVREVQLEGKKRMACGDFLRGFRLEPGTVLETQR